MTISVPRSSRCLALRSSLLLALGLYVSTAMAAYPDKPIRMVIHYPPGGATELIGRIAVP